MTKRLVSQIFLPLLLAATCLEASAQADSVSSRIAPRPTSPKVAGSRHLTMGMVEKTQSVNAAPIFRAHIKIALARSSLLTFSLVPTGIMYGSLQRADGRIDGNCARLRLLRQYRWAMCLPVATTALLLVVLQGFSW
jgi:hypothetical protein